MKLSNITLYSMTDDNRKINKHLGSGVTFDCKYKDGVSVINPVYIISYGNVLNYNYLHDDFTGRYYYIDNIVMIPSGLAELHCTVDVLKTYAYNILNSTQLIIRSADTSRTEVSNSMVADNLRLLKPSSIFENVQITNASDIGQSDNYILTVLSGSVGKFAQPVTPPEPTPPEPTPKE